jgi:hypothetical protein
MDNPTQTSGDRRRVIVEHVAVAHKGDVSLKLPLVIAQKRIQAWRARLLLTLNQNGN